MLYVFLVSSGTMMTFDMSLAMGNVYNLQKAIAQACSIPEGRQVLLISGGTALRQDCIVSKYSAGTDTNPIFLFTRSGDDVRCGSFAEDELDSFSSMEERVKACENMAPDYQTLAARSQLARDLADLSNHEFRLCSQLVDSQHLQQQGWSALAANLEDHAKNMKKAFERFNNEMQCYFEARPLYENLLASFPSAVEKLDKVPLLPIFLSEEEKNTSHTLFTKYAAGPTGLVLELADSCKNWIDKLTTKTLTRIHSDVNKLLTCVSDPSMKEIAGIEDRLFKLNEMLQDAQKNAVEQCKYAESLCAHHNRISSINDHSILNDLCRTHQMQLKIMLDHHKRLMETREKCRKAKCELSANLKARITMVANYEQQIFNLENEFALYREQLKRLNSHLNFVEQMHLAPEVYIKTLVEIRRRKIFSTNFLKWASNLSEQSLELYKKEVNARETFNRSYPSHIFLNNLFLGLADLPPPFATENPKPFDVLLPNVTQEDLDKLKKLLPEFAALIEVPPPDVMPHTSHKSAVSDSAFSSEVPSSQGLVGPSHSSTSLQSGQLFRTETSSSLGAGECAGLVPEILSPTSSPFEDPFLPTTEMEVSAKHGKLGKTKKLDDSGLECKKIHLTETGTEKEMFSPIAEEQNNESDGDEFERVDSVPKSYDDPFVTNATNVDSKQVPVSDKMSRSNTECTGTHSDALKAQVEELQLSPSEGIQSPESNVTSHDFHSADYFIDDSMPSSYTESTGMSALGRNQHMVKSHHVIVAELQHQINEKRSALVGAQGSLRMSRSADLLKMHATMSALQKFVQDFHSRMASDLKMLRDFVMMRQLTVKEEACAISEGVRATVNAIQSQAELEKASAIEEALKQERKRNDELLKEKHAQFEIEVQKLIDANREIEIYQEQILHFKVLLEEMREDFDYQFQKTEEEHTVQLETLKQCMSLEHEFELESLQEETKRKIQEKDNEISKLVVELSEKEDLIRLLMAEKESLACDLNEEMRKEREQWTEIVNAQHVAKSSVAVQIDEGLWQFEEHVMAGSTQEEYMKEDTQIARLDEEDDILSITFQNKQLLVQLSSELDRIWNAVSSNLGENVSGNLYQNFIGKMKVHVEQILTEKFMQAHKEQVEDTKEQEENYLVQLQLLKDVRKDLDACFHTYGYNCSYKDFIELSKKNSELCGKFEQIVKVFQNLYTSLNYHKSLIRVLKENGKEWELEKEALKLQIQETHQKHIEDMERLKTLHIAESQVSFNEAIHKVTREKDELIAALRNDISLFQMNQGVVKSVIGNFLDRPDTDVEASDDRLMERSQLLKRTLSEIKEKIDQPRQLLLSGSTVCESYSDLIEKNLKLEKALHQEKKKLQKVFEKVSKASHLKLSLLTCEPGDLILFYYSGKHRNYVAFQFESTLHFLHTDGLEILDLKIPPDSSTTPWAIGVVVDKDYCLAKKRPNRYNVSNGAVFYCVKVKAWVKGREIRLKAQTDVANEELPTFTPAADEAMGEASTSNQMSASAM